MNIKKTLSLSASKASVFFGLALSVIFLFFYFYKAPFAQRKKIAIITSTMLGEFHKTVVGAFQKKLTNSGKNYTSKVFTPNGVNKILLAAMTEEAVESNFDLILTIGAAASQVAKSVLQKRNSVIPQVFTGIGDPVKTGLVQSLSHPGTGITGVEIAQGTSLDGIKILLKIKPEMKHLAIPYWAESDFSDLKESVAEITSFLEPYGIRVTGVPFSKVNEIIPRLTALSNDIDAITYFDYCSSKDAASGMVKLCNQNSITLFACNLAGVRKGAAAGYGSDIENLGYEAFATVDYILSQSSTPKNIPIKILSQAHRLGVNKKTMSTQGLTFSNKNAHLLRDAVIYDSIEDTND